MASHQEQSHHIRSNSLQVGSHPIALQFEDELENMKRWASSAEASTSQGSEMLCTGLEGLVKLNSYLDDLLKMPCNQRAIARCKNEKWLVEELDGSVRLLDMCSSTRDSLSLMKEQAQDLQSTLRTRRVGDKISQSKLQFYTAACKKTTKEVSKGLKELKQINERCEIYPEMVNDEDLFSVVRALKEVREVTIAVYRSMFSMISSKDGGCWSLVSKKVMLKNKIATYTSISGHFFDLCKKMSSKDMDVVEIQKQIKELESGVAAMENGPDSLFQGLVRSRVALLNIINL